MHSQKTLSKDISARAVQRAVAANASQTPLTLYSAVLGVLGAAYALLIDANTYALVAMGAGGGLTSLSWLWEYFVRGNVHAMAFVERYRKTLSDKREQALATLRADLNEANDAQGLKQVQLFSDKYQNFVELLARKLDEHELTYQRYLTIAEQVFLAGLDNLEQAALALKSVSAIDVPHIQAELSRQRDTSSAAEQQRARELNARLALRQSQLDRASALILANEQALTSLDQVSARISKIKTHQGRAQLDLEDAMNELRELTRRTDHYSQK